MLHAAVIATGAPSAARLALRMSVHLASCASVTGRLRTTAANKKPRHSFEPGVFRFYMAWR
jgi:hypothetical protein